MAENADIFEYIKCDIVSHLLSKASEGEITLDETTIPHRLAYPILLLQKPVDILRPLLDFFGPLGKVFDGYKKLHEELETEREEINKKTDEKAALTDYCKETENAKGSPYEKDFFSQLIINLLEQWKENDERQIKKTDNGENIKETVLIIDDLDRIDPQHIFRLLNVFAAHFDSESGSSNNKFRFDKVVFVCDIENIRGIFSHFYGALVGFSGYIDKFYSITPYYFNPSLDIAHYIEKFLVFNISAQYLPLDETNELCKTEKFKN